MSRTDKDRPWRVRASDPHQPGRRASHYHTRRLNQKGAFAEHFAEDGLLAECDLPDFHDRRPSPPGWRAAVSEGTWCTWQLEHYVFSPYGVGGVPKWYVDYTWNNPERVRERSELGAARQRYNAGDDLEDFDFPNYQHHHRAAWMYY